MLINLMFIAPSYLKLCTYLHVLELHDVHTYHLMNFCDINIGSCIHFLNVMCMKVQCHHKNLVVYVIESFV